MKKILVAMLALSLLSACAASHAPGSTKGSDAVSITAPDSPHPTREVSHNNGR